jgi:hypothetical protein
MQKIKVKLLVLTRRQKQTIADAGLHDVARRSQCKKVLTGPGYCVCKCWRISIMRLLKFDVVEGRGQQAMKKLRDAALRES